MKIFSTIILAIGAIWLFITSSGIGNVHDTDSAIGVMIFAGVLYLIWGRDETPTQQ